ncbi:MAG: bifunctional DNA primase/polymerase [Blastocatellia bacterium]
MSKNTTRSSIPTPQKTELRPAQILSLARAYVESGLCVIPIKTDGSKAPALRSWKDYQARRPNDGELRRWFGNGGRPGIAIIGGAICGNLEIIDFDAPELIAEWRELVELAAPGLLDQLTQVETPKGGLHVFYRCAEIAGNSKLAQNEAGHTLIETRGEGGYVITVGSPPACHPSGKTYELINGKLKAIPEITPAEREILFDCACSFNERIEPEPEPPQAAAPSSGLRPGDDFNERGDSRTLLEKHGWKYLGKGRRGELWARPGVSHTSGTRLPDGALYVFSSNATPFEPRRTYKPFSIYALLEHGSDWQAAAKALASEGYGEQSRQAKQSTAIGNGAGAKGTKQSANTGASSQTTQAKQTGAQTKKKVMRKRKVDPIDLTLSRATLFHNAEGRQYASIKINGHIETRLIESTAFLLWLNGAYFEDVGAPLHGEEFSKTVRTLRAIAQFKSGERCVHLRVAEHDGNVYVDLADEQWRIVEITPDTWRVIESTKSPVLFTRRNGMLALPEPIQGGALSELRSLINCEKQTDDDAWTLIACWLVMGFHPFGPYPILSVGGEQGSGKSTTSRMLQQLIDPNAGELRGVPKDERDLMIAANNCWLMAYDNLSGVSQEISDRLCRLATGAGFGTRTLHTNDEETIFRAKRPILVNGISDFHHPDFLDRYVSVYLRQIPDSERRDEKEIWSEFDQAKPRILGALLSGVSYALKNRESVKLDRKPRMADFAIWASAAEAGLGLAKGAFIKAYEGNRAAAHEVALDTSPAKEIQEFLEQQETLPWEGRASDLLNALNQVLKNRGEDPDTKYSWPKQANKLTEVLRRIAPNLRARGFEVDCDRTKRGSKIKIQKKG